MADGLSFGGGGYFSPGSRYVQLMRPRGADTRTTAGGLDHILQNVLYGLALKDAKDERQAQIDKVEAQKAADAAAMGRFSTLLQGTPAQPAITGGTVGGGRPAIAAQPGDMNAAAAALFQGGTSPELGRLGMEMLMSERQRAAEAEARRQERSFAVEDREDAQAHAAELALGKGQRVETAEGVFWRTNDGNMTRLGDLPPPGGTTLNLTTSTLPDAPSGYMYEFDGTGRPSGLIPIPGGPAEREITAEAEAEGERREQDIVGANIVVEDIGRIERMVADADIPATGLSGAFAQHIPGTSAANVSKLLDSIRANVGFDELQRMRAASPTGGALGQVSERENTLLQSALGSLEQSLTEEEFLFNLNRVKDTYLDVIHGPGNRPGMGMDNGDLDVRLRTIDGLTEQEIDSLANRMRANPNDYSPEEIEKVHGLWEEYFGGQPTQ